MTLSDMQMYNVVVTYTILQVEVDSSLAEVLH